MKNHTRFIFVCSLFLNMVVCAQTIVIKSDAKKGCDELTVNFSFTTTIPTVASVKWNFGNGDVSTSISPMYTYTVPGTYSVSLVINDTASVTEIEYVKLGITPKFQVFYKDTIGSYTLEISASVENANPLFPFQYKWDIQGGITETIPSFIHQFDAAGSYDTQLVISDPSGCADTVKTVVTVSEIFNVPNVITPNDDGYNDNFRVTSNQNSVLKLRIFAPTGLMVYQIDSNNPSWDGKLPSGEKVNPGIYFYVIESVDDFTPVKKSGFFYLYW